MIGTNLGESGHPKNNRRVWEKKRSVGAEEQKSGWKRGEFLEEKRMELRKAEGPRLPESSEQVWTAFLNHLFALDSCE